MSLPFTFRPAQPSDAPAVADLIGGLAHYFLADPAAAEAGPSWRASPSKPSRADRRSAGQERGVHYQPMALQEA